MHTLEEHLLFVSKPARLSLSNVLLSSYTKTGFTLNNSIHQLLAARYGETDMTIDFDNFVACVMRLEMMFSKLALLF